MINEVLVNIFDELYNEKKDTYDTIQSTAKLNLDTGWILEAKPSSDCGHSNISKHPDYLHTYCTMNYNGNNLEFSANIEPSGQYKVQKEELMALKTTALESTLKKPKI